ncbi:hypothetical protein GGQ80_002983 [Sphingomonas jinjuensis]|uniref:Uncharacterized protein n=1 Tax=Sphingomonas jinjuensis TaxID=535907 RepID=A0A840FFU0_9SPHN|nr:hypothetical protein [Sphingomonas jinjuensis]MBB4155066.1 hypothetical protein [Sphingomonas jinjuensis]
MFDDLKREVSERLAAMFRECSGEMIRLVSLLVVDACAAEGVDLDALADTMRPDDVWRRWLGGPPPPLTSPSIDRLGREARRYEAGTLPRLLRCGVVVREHDDPRGALGVRAGAHCLELGMTMPAAALRTRNGEAFLCLRCRLPDTVISAAYDRPLDEIVDHPVLRGSGYRVTRAKATHWGRTHLAFRAEPVAWLMPWVRDHAPISPEPGTSPARRGG